MMKTIRLTTHWEIDQIIDILELLDELRDALINAYQQELDQYHQERWAERPQEMDRQDNLDLFDDNIDF